MYSILTKYWNKFLIHYAAQGIIPMDDEVYLKKLFKQTMGYELDLENPKTFSEKLQWLKLYNRLPEYSNMVDKYEVKRIVADRIGEQYVIPALGVWNHFDEIDFDTLPDQFVLKCTHDFGSTLIVKDKGNFDKEARKKQKKRFDKALKNQHYYCGREWPYKNVTPRIVAEKYMEDSKTGECRDYKFFCFGGRVKCFKVDFNRFKGHRANYFDENGNLLKICEDQCPPDFNVDIDIPAELEEMKYLANKLAKVSPFLRVDFYDIDGKVYFGELTFYPGGGMNKYTPDTWDLTMGEWLKLPGM